MTGVPSGVIEIDRITEGFHPGHLILIAGRRRTCKTSLALTISLNAATHERQPLPVVFFSLEMPAEEAIIRMLCSQADVALETARSGYLRRQDVDALKKAAARLGNTPILIDEDLSLSPETIHEKCESVRQEFGERLGLVVLDYFQLLRITGVEPCPNASATGWFLKNLAEELRVPVILFFEISEDRRASERPPLLSDLGDSGILEYADVVALMNRASDDGVVHIQFVRHPIAVPSTAIVAFQPKTGLLRSYDPVCEAVR